MKKRWVISLSVLVLVGLIGDGIYVAMSLPGRLRAAQAELEAAQAGIESLDLEAAAAAAAEARDSSQSAYDLVRHPTFLLATLFPGLSRDLETIQAVSDAAVRASSAGALAVDMAGALSEESFGDRLYSQGRFDLSLMAQLGPTLERIVRELEPARVALRDTPTPLWDSVKEAAAIAEREITRAVESATRGARALRVAPELLGADSPQRYLLLFQSPSEARATGGLIGFLGILEADDGRLRLVERFPTPKDLPPSGAIDVPTWYREHYGYLGALRDIRQSNLSPHFPIVAGTVLEILDQTSSLGLEGVLAMDPVLFAELTRATGPIMTPQLDVPVGPDNAVNVLLRQSYEDLDPVQQSSFLAELLDQLWLRISQGVDSRALIDAVGTASSRGRLKMWVRNAEAQEVVAQLDLDGWVDDDARNVQMVWHNQIAPIKVDYFLRRTVRTDIQLREDRSAGVVVSARLENQAPTEGPATLLYGPGFPDQSTGDNLMHLHFMLPEEARVEDVTWPGVAQPSAEELELGEDGLFRATEDRFPLRWEELNVPGGTSETVSLGYSIPDAVGLAEGHRTFDFTLLPQVVVTPDVFETSVSPPPGYVFEEPEQGALQDGVWFFEGELETPLKIELVLRPV